MQSQYHSDKAVWWAIIGLHEIIALTVLITIFQLWTFNCDKYITTGVYANWEQLNEIKPTFSSYT